MSCGSLRVTCIRNKLNGDTLGRDNMKDIRKKMEQILKDEFHGRILQIHDKDALTQERMANALIMDRRSFADIERGEHMCGELTIIFILIYLEDANPLLQSLKRQFEQSYQEAEVFV